MAWTKQLTRERVGRAIDGLSSVEIVDLVRDTDLRNIPLGKAYRTQGVHLYVDLPNATSLLGAAGQDGQRSHQRFLRFLHIFQRVARVVIAAAGAMKVDHQNQRLHLVVHKPYDNEWHRVAVAVTVAQVLRDTIAGANELHDELPDARVCVGIESGVALAVNNGTRGDREPLFIGEPANRAAKLLVSGSSGIFLGHAARTAAGPSWNVAEPDKTALTDEQIVTCMKESDLDLTPSSLLKKWERDLEDSPLADFTFQRPTPPLAGLDLDALTPANSRRLEAAVIMADIDGFTRFVSEALAQGTEASAVRILHVIRKELRDVLNDFGGRKIRYVGDCIVGVLAEGTSRSTDLAETVSTAVRCAAAMRDAFGIVQQTIVEAEALGLGIGVELGPVSITRLGVQGDRDRCIAGRAVLEAQAMQERCGGADIGLGETALAEGTSAIKGLFAGGAIQPGLTYNRVISTEKNAGHSTSRVSVPSPAPNVVIPRAHCR